MNRSYIGTYVYQTENNWRRPYLATRADVFENLSDIQKRWLTDNSPDWLFWRDEFRRRHYHIYSKTPISDNRLMVAAMIFYQEKPSHVPLGEEALWAGVFKN